MKLNPNQPYPAIICNNERIHKLLATEFNLNLLCSHKRRNEETVTLFFIVTKGSNDCK